MPKVINSRLDLIAHGVHLTPAHKTASQGSEINLIDLSEDSSTEEDEGDMEEEEEGLYNSAESEAERGEKLRKIREGLRASHAQNIARYLGRACTVVTPTLPFNKVFQSKNWYTICKLKTLNSVFPLSKFQTEGQ